jgi:acyl-CoA synthetase (AMP-forming)/AMP-acid ligase II
MEFNLADLFECVADHVPEREALVCGPRRLTYRDLEQRANRLAHGLQQRGVSPGDLVGLYLYNCVEFLEAMLACYKLRAVPVNINYRYVEDELAQLFGDADLTGVIYHEEFGPRLAGLESRWPRRLALLVEVEGPDQTLPGAGVAGAGVAAPGVVTPELAAPGARAPAGLSPERYDGVLDSGSAVRDFPSRSADDHYILYTGGTTGLPKGVVWRQEDIFFASLGAGNPGGPPIQRPDDIGAAVLSNRAQRVRPFLAPGDPGPARFSALSLGPLMHASGQWLALGTLLGGGTVVLYPHRQMDMARVLELVEREGVTMLSLVGDASARPLIEALEAVSEPGAHPFDTSSLLLLGSGGSILTAEAKARLFEVLPALLAITEAIGSSEAPVQGLAVATRSGNLMPSLRFRAKDVTAVFDDDLRPVAPGSGQVGRLATRGYVPLGYYNDPDKSARTFVEVDGVRWSLPGDMATVEADGTIHLLGRGAMCINTGGEKVYPEEVEAVLKAHPKVADAVVVGIDDARWGQQVAAVVQRDGAGRGPSLEELQDHCRSFLAGYKLPRTLRLVGEVVRTPAGKADYRWARQVASQPDA